MSEVVDLRDIVLAGHVQVFRLLNLLGRELPASSWCVAGGLMVVIAGRAWGAVDERSQRTKDGDIVVDVVADAGILQRARERIEHYDFKAPPEARQEGAAARCTFVDGAAQVDLLAPDDADEVALDLGDGFVSLAIPGGRRALEAAQHVTVLYSDDYPDADLRVPLGADALLVKADACVDGRTADQSRHIQDLAFLLATIPDPRLLRELADADRELLVALTPRLADESDVAWTYLDVDHRNRALASLRVATG